MFGNVGEIVRWLEETAKKCDNGKIYLSILTARNLLKKKPGYLDDEKKLASYEKWNCRHDDLDCNLNQLESLQDTLVITLIIEELIFEVKAFDDHKYQNCYVIGQYLSYIYDTVISTNNRKGRNGFIQRSNALYELHKDKYDAILGAPKPVQILKNKEPHAIVPASNIKPSVSFSNVVKSNSESVPESDAEIDDIIGEIEELRDIKSKYDNLVKEHEALKVECNKAKAYAVKARTEISKMETTINKYEVSFQSLKSKLKK